MNNKGFAITTVVYSIIILLSLLAVTVMAINKSEYENEKNYINDINEELTECLTNRSC